ncbi:DUF3168 domain-containing protein [Rhizobium sp. SL42]|uniref:DUF3168 domain-containing protein n=1 Tax=Rhizobium sp. SL42 TaxID=2806346 RepID=UPI001F367F8C|nr:DUF3168 domain-containing protein [Rhizobium sp. SL42]UJW76549.1 DUF3168 domain-containing protein [Rhizobium sp. SL42]
MSAPVNELLAALQRAVVADAALAASIGAEGFSDRRLRATRLPAASIGNVEARDWSTGTETGFEIILTLEAWSERGRREAEEVAEGLRRVAQGLPPELASFRLVNMVHRRTVSRREAKTGLFVAEVTMRAVVE